MNRKVSWSEPARFDLRRLRSWAERFGTRHAREASQRIKKGIETIEDHPRIGHRVPAPGGDEELRELVFAPFIIRYVLTDEDIIVVRIWRGRAGDS